MPTDSLVTPGASTRAADTGRNRAQKSAKRRDELVDSALVTLGELGVARTSLREIAANSTFSHGVVHYYFSDKAELIIASVRRYKATCVTRYDGVISSSTTPAELVAGFAAKLAETIVDDAAMHRLWYDLRTQSMFDESLRHDVLEIDATLEGMIQRVLVRYAELSDTTLTVPGPTAYAMLDGVFERALLRHIAGVDGVLDDLRATTVELLPRLFSPKSG
ncbi:MULTISPECIES: TetR/AcrR family transcriptional regulator [unclassified Knoellia]|uniref:TetR/AcrR family transcriptional regulator n=1 Tax=Knoellia altitudinis TaxID=3404795 RepID=UPI00362320A1